MHWNYLYKITLQKFPFTLHLLFHHIIHPIKYYLENDNSSVTQRGIKKNVTRCRIVYIINQCISCKVLYTYIANKPTLEHKVFTNQEVLKMSRCMYFVSTETHIIRVQNKVNFYFMHWIFESQYLQNIYVCSFSKYIWSVQILNF